MEKVKTFVFSFVDCIVSKPGKPRQINNIFLVKLSSTEPQRLLVMEAHILQYTPLLCHLLQNLNSSVNFHILQQSTIFVLCNPEHNLNTFLILIGWTLSKPRRCSILPSRSPLAFLSYQEFPKGGHQSLTLQYQGLILTITEIWASIGLLLGFAPFSLFGHCEWCNMENVFWWIAPLVHCWWWWW